MVVLSLTLLTGINCLRLKLPRAEMDRVKNHARPQVGDRGVLLDGDVLL